MNIKAKTPVGWWIVALLSVSSFAASTSDVRLADAAKDQNKDAVRALLKQKVDASSRQPDGATALHWAAHWQDPDTVDLLISAGANVNAATDLGVTPLYLACSNGDAAMVDELLAAGANPNIIAATGVSPLMTASRAGSAEAVRALLAHGADMNVHEKSAGQTALMWAVAEGHPQVVSVLVEHGADVSARSNSRGVLSNISGGGTGEDARGPSRMVQVGGSTAMLFAARQGCVECAKALLAGGANVNDTAPDGNSALVLAAHSGQGAFAAFLLDKGADPNAAGAGYTALHAAVVGDDLDLVKALLAHGANANIPLASGTPMRRGGPEYALPESLVGATPFLLAAKYASADMMAVLAAGGADVHLAAKDGTTPLIAAAGAVHRTGGNLGAPPADEKLAFEAVKLALDLSGDSDVNATNQAGNTALFVAASRGSDTIVELLAEKGAKVDIKNKRGQTALAITLVRPRGNVSGPLRLQSTANLLRKLGAVEPVISISETAGPQPAKNLKILKDASEIKPTMASFTAGLGVQCGFCHVQDRSSDENTHKITARTMMLMVNQINAKFPDGKAHVNCFTCHRGENEPLLAPPAAAPSR
jgi:uncharacterized protein